MEILKKILIGGRYLVRPEEIVLLVADSNYTRIHLSNGRKMIVATTLKELEKRFETYEFFLRVHKSYLINLDYVKQYIITSEEGFVDMKYNHRAAVSRRKQTAFKQLSAKRGFPVFLRREHAP